MAVPAKLYEVMGKLSDDRKGIIYRLALDMLSAQQTEDFDNYSPDEIQAVDVARERISHGDCLSFDSPEKLMTYFGL